MEQDRSQDTNRMPQFDFSKSVMEKILRRAFLDGVIELYENSPHERVHSVALEGDLSLTINKSETFKIKLYEIAQRAQDIDDRKEITTPSFSRTVPSLSETNQAPSSLQTPTPPSLILPKTEVSTCGETRVASPCRVPDLLISPAPPTGIAKQAHSNSFSFGENSSGDASKHETGIQQEACEGEKLQADEDHAATKCSTNDIGTARDPETIVIEDDDDVVIKEEPGIHQHQKRTQESSVTLVMDSNSGSEMNISQLENDELANDTQSPDIFINACPLCHALFKGREFFMIHMDGHRQNFERTCAMCAQGNLHAEDLLFHLVAHHCSVAVSSQDISGFVAGSVLTSHNVNPSPGEKFGSSFPAQESGGGDFKCFQCSREFLTRTMLESHIESHGTGKTPSDTSDVEMQRITCNCDLCGESFLDPGSLANHHRIQHGITNQACASFNSSVDSPQDSVETKVAGDCSFNCMHCGRSFRAWRSLKYHYIASHGLQYACEVCREAFPSLLLLQEHELSHKSTLGEPVYKCNICAKSFPTLTHCTAHKRCHTNAKPHTCETCGSTFFKRGDLTKHVRTVHCPLKHFVCKVCGRTGTRADNMRVHVKLHQKFMTRDQVDLLIEEVYKGQWTPGKSPSKLD